MLRARTLAAVTAAAASGVLLLPSQAQAAGSVHLYRVYYDSPGSDRGGNYSLNGEWAQIRNTTPYAVNLRGWTLTDVANHKYTFGNFTLGAGKIVTVRTGKGTNNATSVYQNRAWYVWNNDKDTATLRKPTGAWVDNCVYNSTASDYKWC